MRNPFGAGLSAAVQDARRPRRAWPMRGRIAAVMLAGALLAAACESTAPRGPLLPIAVVAGASISDTIDARPAQAIVVQVRDSTGRSLAGAVVQFAVALGFDSLGQGYAPLDIRPLDSASYSMTAFERTGADGRAGAVLQLGTVARQTTVTITVAQLGLEDSARITILPGRPARILKHVRDTALYVGSHYVIGASVTDRRGNPRSGDTLSYTAVTSSASVSAAGQVTTVAEGRAVIALRDGPAIDTAWASVVPHGIIAYVQGTQPTGVAVLDLDGSGYHFLHAISDRSVYPQWSPDGASLIMYEGDPSSNARLTLTGLDSVSRTVLQIPQDSLVGMAWPRFAPDGTVYFGGYTAGVGSVVWRVHADGTGLQEIPSARGDGTLQHPAVSPDGRTLLYDHALGTGGLAALDLATGAVTAIGSGEFPVYSPGGSKIAFIRNGTVVVADASGGNAHAITPPGGALWDSSAPSWTSDGQWVAVPTSPLTLIRASDGSSLPLPYWAPSRQAVVR